MKRGVLRIAICAAITLIVGGALLLFDDVASGLPILNLAIWSVLVAAVLLVALRAGRRRRRRGRRERRDSTARGALLHVAPRPAHRLEDRRRLPEPPRR